MAHQFKPPTPLRESVANVPDGLAAVVDRVMQKAPDSRYPSVEELVEALQPFATDLPRRAMMASSHHGTVRGAASNQGSRFGAFGVSKSSCFADFIGSSDDAPGRSVNSSSSEPIWWFELRRRGTDGCARRSAAWTDETRSIGRGCGHGGSRNSRSLPTAIGLARSAARRVPIVRIAATAHRSRFDGLGRTAKGRGHRTIHDRYW